MPSIINATLTNGLVTSADNSGSLQLQTNNGTTAVTIDTSQNVGVGTTSPTTRLNVVNTSYSGSSSPYGIVSSVIGGTTLDNNWGHFVVSQASTTNGDGGKIIFGYGSTPGSDLNPIAAITASKQGDFFGNLLFFTRPSGGSNTERMRITSGGDLLVGTTAQIGAVTGRGVFSSTGNLLALQAGNGSVGAYMTNNSGTGNWQPFSFCNNGSSWSQIGSITCTASATAYNTNSDYRLKENIAPMTGALEKVQQLKPVTYNWKVDGSSGQGFIAHELQAVVPDCVTGEKDAVELVDVKDEEGNVIGQEEKPVYQGVDTSFLVATLTAAIQEQQAQIEELKAKVSALEGVK